ncbi:MAG TPA: protoheme IX farnesyltransferase [Syntrophales bacterium]|nr:protoheme IX farnesyltransferase [Syntrophales bacterium]
MMLREKVRIYLCLCKARISLFSSLSAAMGFFLVTEPAWERLPELLTGVFLLSCGACALNQYLERDADARMTRTARRPIPSGKIRAGRALALSLLLTLSGEGFLFFTGNAAVPLLGAAAVLWYNVVYIGLKRLSAFAVVPGALVGSIPPVMGWAAGGGTLSDPRLASLAFFFFMWQVPHFWLHLLTYGKEYTEAGLPSLTDAFSRDQLERLTFQWLSATAISALLLGLSGLLQSPVAKAGLFAASLWLVSGGIFLLLRHEADHARLFRCENAFMLAVMSLTLIDHCPGFLACLMMAS